MEFVCLFVLMYQTKLFQLHRGGATVSLVLTCTVGSCVLLKHATKGHALRKLVHAINRDFSSFKNCKFSAENF